MNKQAIINYVEEKFLKANPIEFRIGDTVRVHVKIIEGNSTRVQVYEGVVISFKGHGMTRTFTVRKLSFGVGVERIFPLYSPTIEKITVVRSGQVRRAKLYYLRDRVGKASKLEEKDSTSTAPKSVAVQPASKSDNPPSSEPELVSAKDK